MLVVHVCVKSNTFTAEKMTIYLPGLLHVHPSLCGRFCSTFVLSQINLLHAESPIFV